MSAPKQTLHLRVVDVGGLSWWRSILAILGSQGGNRYCRFEAVLDPPASGTAVPPSPTFAVVRGIPDNLPAQAEWSLGMNKALEELQSRLSAAGWVVAGQGELPWELTYEHA